MPEDDGYMLLRKRLLR